MKVTFHPYRREPDYARVSEFLIAHHQPGNRDGNWLEPIWEYMHFHPMLDAAALEKCGIWEASGELVAVCHYELQLGEAFFQFHPEHRHLRGELLEYAEAELPGRERADGRKALRLYINDDDLEFQALARARRYALEPDEARPLYRFDMTDPFPAITLPDGYRLTSLADECDWAKVHQVMWRGFNHGDDVPMNEQELESRRAMFDTPKARRDLKIAVVAPNGDFASFCGMFYEPVNRFGYVEPVATDPRYRRLGLGKAVVLEGIRRCGLLGATAAYVGSDQAFYQSFGFRKVRNCECWLKHLG